MGVDFKIDYMQYTIDHEHAPTGNIKINPVRWYNAGFQDEKTLQRVYYGNKGSKKPLVIASGQSCERMRQDAPLQGYIEQLLEMGASFSRIDIAMDTTGTERISNQYIMEMYRQGKIQSSFLDHEDSEIKAISKVLPSKMQMQTLNIGVQRLRAKRGMIRSYDKGLEQGDLPNVMMRLEIENKRKQAQSMAKNLAKGLEIAQLFSSRFWIDGKHYERVIGTPQTKIQRGEALDSDTGSDMGYLDDNKIAWLLSIAPTIGRMLAHDVYQTNGMLHRTFTDDITKEMMAELNRLYDSQNN